MPYGIVIPESVEPALQSLGEIGASRVKHALAALADLAEHAPPVRAPWHSFAAAAPPLMRTHLQGVRILYEVDPRARVLRVIDIAPESQAARAC